jgi:acylphosphatase
MVIYERGIMKRCRVLVTGMVQGVFFRAFTQKIAQKLGLTGFVRNMPDGRVEAIVEGEEETLKAMLIVLKKGSPNSHVDKIDVEWEAATNEFERFEIR